jgi:predicted phosphate transport protein (TIGR00153 family)
MADRPHFMATLTAMALIRRSVDGGVLDLFEEAGRNVHRASLLLRDMLADFPERSPLARDLLACEQEGDRIAHDIMHRINGGTPRGTRLPFGRRDTYELTRTLDDIVDYAEEAGDELGLYAVEAPMEQAVALSEVLVGASEQVSRALGALRTGADFSAELIEIHRLENEGDRLQREGVASLFAGGIDPMVVIRWKDIFESLEAAVDACESVAHLLEGIALRHRRRK